MEWKPKRDKGTIHIFVVLRMDQYNTPIDDYTKCIMATKAFLTDEEAEEKVARLNKLNADTGAKYFSVIARLKTDAT